MSKLVDAIQFFEAIALRYDRDYLPDARFTRERMRRITAELFAGARVLDLGIGTGREVPALLDAGALVTGLDASPRMLEVCAKRARPVPLVQADFYAGLPFPDGSFDAVLALHGTLSHPPSEDALASLMREIARVLSPRGKLVLEAPHPRWLAELESRPQDDGTRLAVRADAARSRHEDRKAGVVVEATVRDEAEWTALLAPFFATSVEAVSPSEQLVVACKRAPA